MRPLGWLSCGALGLILLGSAVAAPVRAAEDPIVLFDSRSEMEIDLKMVVEDFLPPMLEIAKAEDPAKAEWMALAADLLGVRSLDRLHVISTLSKTEGLYRSTVTLDPDMEGGLLRTMFAVPDGTFRFGKYLRAEDTALLVSLANFSEGLKALYTMVTGPELAALIPPVFTEDENGRIALFGMNLEEDLFPLLRGELDVIVFPPRDGAPGPKPPMALVLGATDGPALRDRLFQILGKQMGEEMTAQLADMPGEKVGAFTLYLLPQNAAYAVSPDFLVVGTDPARLREMLAAPSGNIPEKKARQYMRMSTAFLFQLMNARMQEGPGSPEQQMMAEVFSSMDGEAPAVFELTTNSQPNRLDTELRQPGNLLSMEYHLMRQMFLLMPELTAAQANRGKYVAVVAELDAAFTQYGVDHGGVFPEDPHELVEAGYLEAFPDLSPTPLGIYSEGAYTYLPLRDDQDAVTGYYFFVYGMGEHTGFDMFTPENIADPGSFRPGSDGVLDGVASFCYDGTALDQVKEWNQGR